MKFPIARHQDKSHINVLGAVGFCSLFFAISIGYAAETGTQALDPNIKTAGPQIAAGKPGLKTAPGSGAEPEGSDIQSGKSVAKKKKSPERKAVNLPPKIIWNYYDITASTSKELKAQMRKKGPKGYWAYARWYISWTSDCKISLEINYTMPRWENKDSAAATLKNKWESMISNLAKHEKGHGNHGINAAKEIAKSNCDGANQIINKWAAQDKIFDKETGHGRKQGVVLPQ